MILLIVNSFVDYWLVLLQSANSFGPVLRSYRAAGLPRRGRFAQEPVIFAWIVSCSPPGFEDRSGLSPEPFPRGVGTPETDGCTSQRWRAAWLSSAKRIPDPPREAAVKRWQANWSLARPTAAPNKLAPSECFRDGAEGGRGSTLETNYLTFSSLSTRDTPLTLFAISPARLLAAEESTKPLNSTTPWCTSTSI